MAFLIDPSIFEYKLMRVDVETSSMHCDGQTIVDLNNRSQKKKNAFVCTKMNVEKFWSMVIDAIIQISLISPA